MTSWLYATICRPFVLQPPSVQLHKFFSLPFCIRIRSLTASLNSFTTKRKRKGKQEGRGGRGRQTDKRQGAPESKNRAGRTSKWQRRRKTGKRVHNQEWRVNREENWLPVSESHRWTNWSIYAPVFQQDLCVLRSLLNERKLMWTISVGPCWTVCHGVAQCFQRLLKSCAQICTSFKAKLFL